MQISQKLLPLVGLLSLASLLAFVGTRVVISIRFDQQVSGRLKLAADANSLALAERELGLALAELDGVCAQPGFTSLVYRTPDEDVGFWCENLQATRDDLGSLSDPDDLTESNQLLKVRESLLDHEDTGDAVTLPAGISVYPHNAAFAWWGWLSLLGAMIGLGLTKSPAKSSARS